MVYNRIISDIASFLFPARCLITDQALEKRAENRFISSSATQFITTLHHSCDRCGLPMNISGTPICGICQQQPPNFDRVVSPLLYAEPLRSMIKNLKFNNKLYYAEFFANMIKSKVLEKYAQQNLPQLVIPVPLHKERFYRRGYNQAREISALLSKALHIAHDDHSLIRIKATEEQSELNTKQRQQNLKNAFALQNSLVHIKHVAIVDDVITTGATTNSAAQTLKDEGVEKVDIWVVARTPKLIKKRAT